MTYIKYQERKKEDFVDWSEIGKDMTDMLSKEGERRDKLRTDIAQQSRDYANKIATAEQSNHTGLNEWWLDYGGQASDALLQLDRLFQSGQLKQKDYLAMRQNLMDGTDQALDLVENFSTLYDERMKRLNDGTSSWMEHKNFQELEGFMNFTNSRLSIDPSSYKVGLGFVDENGLPIKDNKTIADLYNRINATQDKYDLSGNLKTSVSRLAKKFQTAGGINDDIRKNKNYKDAVEGYIDAMVTSPYDAASIYGDYMEGDTDAVEMEWDSASGMYKPKLNDAQMAEVREFLRKEIDVMVPKGQRYVTPQAPPKGGKPKEPEMLSNLAKLYQGDDSGVNSAVDYLRGVIIQNGGNVREFKKEGDILTYNFIDKNGEVQSDVIDMNDYNNVQEFVEGNASLFLGVTNVKDAWSKSGIDINKGKGSGSGAYEAPAAPIVVAKEYLNTNIPTELASTGAKAADQLRALVTKFGGEIDTVFLGGDEIKITIGDVTQSFDTDGNPNVRQELIEFIGENADPDKLAGMNDAGEFGDNTSTTGKKEMGKMTPVKPM